MNTGAALLTHALAAVLLGACQLTPERQCELADDHCEGAIAVQCRDYDTPTGNGSRFTRTRCLSPDTCKTDAYGAFCTLDPQVDPRCDPGTFCEGNVGVSCRSGYRVTWTKCGICSVKDGVPSCSGGVGHGCGKGCPAGATCVGLECHVTCDCPTGTECASCSDFGATAGDFWTCVNHVCQLVDATP
ncbi:MAG: hypothetical protein U0263_04575 [Polyangiaceae bacterium]